MEFQQRKSPVEIERDKGRSKWIYWTTWWSVFGGMLASELFLWRHTAGVFGYLSLMLANAAAERACRCAGVSLREKRRETISRDAHAALAPYLSEAPVFSIAKHNKPWASVDREGISLSRGSKRVLWRDVESCEFRLDRAALGHLVSASILMRDASGKKLLHATLTEDQASTLLPAIRFYLRGEKGAL